ncbi:uncharacterized protein LOC114537472 [Dendronephthya gigantea]|uniref:uncharacterized protein LOC114537472 n=1 Tax=Dendronephthya gigantea TaxID=151771 RepID=UPI00106CC1E3|nr:uncharacterized protein LOC114537472 [Dendronephthya gigantea]
MASMAETPELNEILPDGDKDGKRIFVINAPLLTRQLNDVKLIGDPGGGKVILCVIKKELLKLFPWWYKNKLKIPLVIILTSNDSEQQLLLTQRQNLFPTDLRQQNHNRNDVMLSYVLHNQSTLFELPNHDILLYFDVSSQHVLKRNKRRSSLPIEPTNKNARHISPVVIFVANFHNLEDFKKNVFTLYNEYQLNKQRIINRQNMHKPVFKRCHSLPIMSKESNNKENLTVVKILPLSMPTGVDIPQALNLNDQSTQTIDNDDRFKRLYDETKLENEKLMNENELLKRKLLEENNLFEKYRAERSLLENEILYLKQRCHELEKEYKDLLSENGRLLIEMDSKITKEKHIEKLKKIYPTMPIRNVNEEMVTLGVDNNHTEIIPPNHSRTNHVGSSSDLLNEGNVPPESIEYPVQVVEGNEIEPIGGENNSLSTTPQDNNSYKQLLLAIAHSLLSNDVIKLKVWAHEQFSVETNLIATEAMFQLDRKGVINPTNLSALRVFFESILRFDLAHLIQQYCCGDYANLKQLIVKIKERLVQNARERNLHHVRTSTLLPTHSYSPRLPVQREVSNSRNQYDTANGPPLNDPQNSATDTRRNHRSSMFEDIADRRSTRETRGSENSSRRNLTETTTRTSNGIADNSRTEQSAIQLSIRDPSPSAEYNDPSTSHENGRSYLHSDRRREERWLCNHYKRRCMVKFDCCDKYWACHRCHNETSTCQQKKLKSRDTTMVKCMECGKEQQFGENGQFCVSCNTQFADFYCGICKHLTGRDDHPYHCEKCGICRIHGDRSYHCDVCGVCLDVQLRGNHKCRPDSAHDVCGICLEDAFTGCQILPCSHKVHKECSTQMIQSGLTRCPICRESFAHKLQRRPTAGRKPSRRRR